MSGFKKPEITQIMHRRDRTRTLICRLQHLNIHGFQTLEHLTGAIRYFLGLSHLAAGKVGARNMQILCGVEKRFHGHGSQHAGNGLG
ncbi:hypothetical protein ACTXGQ_13160 [Marinobacter sp. 1Y8]